jgi:hypothetical protein
MRGEDKVTLPKAYCITLPVDTALWTSIVFTRVHFYFVFRFVCDGWQNRVMCLHQVLCEDTSEENTTRYWREQKARNKLQIAEELNNGLMKTKSRLLQQTLGNKIQFGTNGRLPWEVKNFTKLRKF